MAVRLIISHRQARTDRIGITGMNGTLYERFRSGRLLRSTITADGHQHEREQRADVDHLLEHADLGESGDDRHHDADPDGDPGRGAALLVDLRQSRAAAARPGSSRR